MSAKPLPTPPRIGERSLFPALAARAYLHHAAIAPMCTPVADAIARAVADYAANGAGAFARWALDRERLRAGLATLIGARPSEVALGSNTSRGVSDIALSIPWQTGDRVVLFRGEFPANVAPWQQAARCFGLELCFLEADDFMSERGLERLRRELERGARLVAVSFVQFQTGLRMPLAEIGRLCESFGAELFVDAIQGVGVLPFDVRSLGVHYASSGAHKWLLGVEGAAFTYVREDKLPALEPRTAGWLSQREPERFLFEGAGLLDYDKPLKEDASVFESGTSSLLSLAALSAAVELLAQLDGDAVVRHITAFNDALEPELVGRGFQSRRASDPALRSAILSVLPPPELTVPELARGLRQRGVFVGTPDGHLRFAPHFANSLAEVPEVLSALDEVMSELRR